MWNVSCILFGLGWGQVFRFSRFGGRSELKMVWHNKSVKFFSIYIPLSFLVFLFLYVESFSFTSFSCRVSGDNHIERPAAKLSPITKSMYVGWFCLLSPSPSPFFPLAVIRLLGCVAKNRIIDHLVLYFVGGIFFLLLPFYCSTCGKHIERIERQLKAITVLNTIKAEL